MALGVVQVTPVVDGQNLSPTVTVTFGSPVTAGNLVLFVIGSTNGTTFADPTSGPSDGLSNTYAKIRGDTQAGDFGTNMWVGAWYAKNINGGSCAPSATFAVNIGNAFGQAVEVGGADTVTPLDNSDVVLGPPPTSPSGTLSTTAANTILFEVLAASLFAGTTTKGASFTLDGDFTSSVAILAHQILSSSGSQTYDGTLGSGDQYLLSAVAFAASGAPPPAANGATLRTQQRAPSFPPGAPLPGIAQLGQGILGKGLYIASGTVRNYPSGDGSGITVRVYREDTGTLIAATLTGVGGTWNINLTYSGQIIVATPFDVTHTAVSQIGNPV